MSFYAVFKMHWRHMLSRKEYLFVVTALAVILTGSFVESCLTVRGLFTSALNSAAVGWSMHLDQQANGINTGRVLIFLLFGVLAALIYGDSLFRDKQENVLCIAAARGKKNVYLLSGALTAFLGAFVTFFLFFALGQLLALVVFPLRSSFFGYLAEASWADGVQRPLSPLFPGLFYQHPYLNNLVFMGYASCWAGILSLMTYTASFFLRNRLVLLGLPQLFLILESFIGVLAPNIQLGILYYLYPMNILPEKSVLFFILAPLITLLLIAAAFYKVLRSDKRELYL